MEISISNEIKIRECRVGIIPSGVNVAVGVITEQAVAKAHQMEYCQLKDIIDDCREFSDHI